MEKIKILLVDDDEVFRDAVEKNLQSQGYEVVIAQNGLIALEVMNSQIVDLVISDIRMPEMDGLGLLKAIRQKGNLPVILITGFSDIIETKSAYQLGADEFLAKPFQRSELLEAIQKCLGPQRVATNTPNEEAYCKIGIGDFLMGKTIQFNVFVLIADEKYIKIAHKGEDISPERIHFYQMKGLQHLYLRKEDFRQYVGFSLKLATAARKVNLLNQEKKINLLRYTGEVLNEQVRHDGVDPQLYESAAAFVEATVDILTDDVNATLVLEALKNHSDHLLVHSVAVSLYSVIIAQAMEWVLPNNKLKIAMGGLFHDVGMKEIEPEILHRPRYSWSVSEVKSFEEHPMRGIQILNEIEDISDDVRDVVKQHHENCLSMGYPLRMKKTSIHPMAKLISVADEFCYRTIKGPNSIKLGAIDALQDMLSNCGEQLDKKFFGALVHAFKSAEI